MGPMPDMRFTFDTSAPSRATIVMLRGALGA